MNVPLCLPPTKTMPEISLAYHSAASESSPIGLGWVMKGTPRIERVPATLAQDGFRGTAALFLILDLLLILSKGVVNYDENDRFALDGQRLVKVSGKDRKSVV